MSEFKGYLYSFIDAVMKCFTYPYSYLSTLFLRQNTVFNWTVLLKD